jgi:hypothetical protein
MKMNKFFSVFPCTGALMEWNWQGKTEVLGGKTCSSAILSTTNPTWTDPDLRGERPATNHLNHGTAACILFLSTSPDCYGLCYTSCQWTLRSDRAVGAMTEQIFLYIPIFNWVASATTRRLLVFTQVLCVVRAWLNLGLLPLRLLYVGLGRQVDTFVPNDVRNTLYYIYIHWTKIGMQPDWPQCCPSSKCRPCPCYHN